MIINPLGSRFPSQIPSERLILSSTAIQRGLAPRNLSTYASTLDNPRQLALHYLLKYTRIEDQLRDPHTSLLWLNHKRDPAFRHYISSRVFFDRNIINPLEAMRSFGALEDGAELFSNIPSATDKPQIVDFQGSELAKKSNLDSSESGVETLVYDERIAFLSEGDTVQFTNQQFRIGSFLGAGNSTHIYALKDDPTQVLRIPYLIPRISAYLMAEYNLNPIEGAQALMLNHMSKRPDRDDVAVVKTVVDPDGEYALADRVNGTLNGFDFLNHIEGIVQNSPLKGFRYVTALNLLGHDVEVVKLRHLEAVIQYERKILSQDRSAREIARQYVWDETSKAWVLVDWE